MEEIDVTIDPDGKVRLSVRGIPGESCLDATADIEAALGNSLVRREMTAEALEPKEIRPKNAIYLHHGK